MNRNVFSKIKTFNTEVETATISPWNFRGFYVNKYWAETKYSDTTNGDEKTQAIVMGSKENGLEVNAEQIKNMYAEASSPKCWKKSYKIHSQQMLSKYGKV